jgi:N-acetyl-anhydromuramyl-L-alanine amidase AmpD
MLAALETMDPEDRIAFERALINKAWSVRKLHEKLEKYGYEVSYWQVKSHRQQACDCHKKKTVK